MKNTSKILCRRCGAKEAQHGYKTCIPCLEWTRHYRKSNRLRQNKNNKASKRRRKVKLREFMNTIKCNPCSDCCLSFDPCAMDFDHRDQSVKYDDISSIVNRRVSLRLLQEELKKCDLVCVNCHRIRTYTRKPITGYARKDHNRIFEFITSLKKIPCLDCNKTFPSYVMEFDHVDPASKIAEVGQFFRMNSFASIIAEIKKCEIVCAVCHRLREKKRRTK